MASEPPTLEPDSSRRWLWLAGAALLMLASLPQTFGWLIAPEGRVYGGILKNNGDALSYLAKMREGWEGRWLYTDRYAVEPHPPALVYTFYLVLGHLARWTGLSLAAVYQLARVAAGGALLLAVGRLLRRLGLPGPAPVLAFLLVFTASGLGWLLSLAPGGSRPFEYWVVEAHAFPSMLNYPHFALATALLALAFAEFNDAKTTKQSAGIIALCSFLLAWVHPRLLLNLFAVGATAGALAWLRERRPPAPCAIRLLAIAVGGGPPLAATFLSLRSDPFWRAVADPAMGSPPISEFLLGYGLLWPLALRGAWIAWRARQPWTYLLIGWMIAGLYIVYLPFGSARRLIHGFNLPLAILAAWAIWAEALPWLRARLGARRALAAVAGLWLLLSLTTWTLLGQEINHLRRRSYPTFYPASLARAGEWLRVNAGRDEVVLGSLPTGALLPGMAGCRVVVGHWAETPQADAKSLDVKRFFDAATASDDRGQILKRYGVDWAVVGPRELELGAYDPSGDPRWETAWREAEIAVYRLKETAKR